MKIVHAKYGFNVSARWQWVVKKITVGFVAFVMVFTLLSSGTTGNYFTGCQSTGGDCTAIIEPVDHLR